MLCYLFKKLKFSLVVYISPLINCRPKHCYTLCSSDIMDPSSSSSIQTKTPTMQDSRYIVPNTYDYRMGYTDYVYWPSIRQVLPNAWAILQLLHRYTICFGLGNFLSISLIWTAPWKQNWSAPATIAHPPSGQYIDKQFCSSICIGCSEMMDPKLELELCQHVLHNIYYDRMEFQNFVLYQNMR